MKEACLTDIGEFFERLKRPGDRPGEQAGVAAAGSAID